MLYEDLCSIDLIAPIRKELDSGLFRIDPKTQKVVSVGAIDPRKPWVNNKIPQDRDCRKWHGVYFSRYGLIPKGCYDCWKIVAQPKSLRQLMLIDKLQKSMGLPSKCGMERRPYASGIYNAFWYGVRTEGLEGGRDLCEKIDQAIKKEVGLGVVVFLKRACTEFEMKYGPSDKWEYTDRDTRLEQMLDSLFDLETILDDQPPYLKAHITKQWIEWAWMDGDETWKEFAEPESFILPAVTYHNSGNGVIELGKEAG